MCFLFRYFPSKVLKYITKLRKTLKKKDATLFLILHQWTKRSLPELILSSRAPESIISKTSTLLSPEISWWLLRAFQARVNQASPLTRSMPKGSEDRKSVV